MSAGTVTAVDQQWHQEIFFFTIMLAGGLRGNELFFLRRRRPHVECTRYHHRVTRLGHWLDYSFVLYPDNDKTSNRCNCRYVVANN